MNQKKCFELGCKNEVEYACKCTSPESFFCEMHIERHIKIRIAGRDHSFDSIFAEPNEETKQAVLRFLMKEDSKYRKLKKLIINSYNQRLANLEKDASQYTRNLNTFSANVGNLVLEICKAKKSLKSNRDSISELLTLQPEEAVNKVKSIISAENDWYNGAKLFHIYSKDLENLITPFINMRFQAFLNTMLSNKERSIEANNKTINSARIKVANIKDSISLKANENSESLKVLQNLIRLKTENESEAMLLNSKINSITSDINSKLKKIESQLNLMNINSLRHKTAEFLSRPNNRELDMDFRATCSAYQNNSSIYDPLLAQAYQDYLNAYQQKISLYNIIWKNKRTEFYIYNTETETKEVKILQTPEPLDWGTCITQFPNGKLFCFGSWELSGITLLFDVNGRVEVLPSGTSCGCSSCIYFNNSVYCFGGYDGNILTISSRFDLDQNRWIQLTPLPNRDGYCNSIIFNGNILISGYKNKNLWLYSIDIDSFSTIPYEFGEDKRKILINTERLYLIECFNGSIYESEIGSDTKWKRIAQSIIKLPHQVYCSYNKGGIYIGIIDWHSDINYFKFDLNEKRLIGLK